MQSCESCIHFKKWEGTLIGECIWDKPTPSHIRKYGTTMKVPKTNDLDRGGYDFGEDCPAWEKK